VTATDGHGNTASATGTLAVDTSTSVAITSPGATADPTPTISGTGEPGALVEVTVDGQTLTATADASGVWSVPVPVALADGTYPVSVTATDAAGNTASATQGLHVDSSIASAITSPDATGDSTPTISGTGEPGATVVVAVDGQTLTATVDASGVWSVDVPVALADGTYPVSVTATDTSGNTVTTVQQLTVDTIATLTSTSPTLTNDSTPVIGGIGTPGDTVTVVVGPHTLVTTVGDDGEWSVSVPTDLADGTHLVEVATQDPLGNVASSDFALEIDTVVDADTTPPNSSSDGQISGTAEPGATVTVTVGGTTTTVVVSADGTWAVPMPAGLPAGDVTVRVATVDTAGNAKVESFTASAPQQLPTTGSEIAGFVRSGFLLAVAGAFLVLVASRPRRHADG
jgi:hypothetical protein